MNPIKVFQKEWAFTTAESPKTQIQTSSFGPCYVVTFTSGKFAALTHIDDTTNVDSMTSIFNKFIENSVSMKDVKVIVLGGWIEHPESFKWGQKVLEKIQSSGFQNVSTNNMYTKKALSAAQQVSGISLPEVPTHYHYGALVDAKTGKTFVLKEASQAMETQQKRLMKEFTEKNIFNLEAEHPLKQAT